MALTIYTGKIGSYRGLNGLDITAKSTDPIGKIFAPTWAMVMPIINARRNGVSDVKEWARLTTAYKAQYQQILDRADQQNSLVVRHILNMDIVVLLCYCGRKQFCHRDLMAKWLVDKGAVISKDGWI